ncbi:uncharacterized protein GGS22DRAFT_86189 [Annulohypoxylon maeteangense]|uniref:uncharacterized protein n=1 Tax=Annulohypoxylon maeteangense TaxID=1927788 RepID=UPI002007724E|nr:uncharacterized protein GGS22DRAFT_86189 [Annulohypoxylon maeteangense]KAI0880309.1 hypothetical protein GGS22DRAFT_86189 [Annulohypoxylon maeteangense]
MSFFNKLTSKLDGLDLGSEKPREREGPGYPGQHSYPPPSQQYGSNYNQQPYPPYGDRPPQSASPGNYQAPYPSQGSYNSPPPQGSYNTPPPQSYQSSPAPLSSGPTYSPPPDKPPIPSGWVPQYDQQYQRWYYYEQATGRSQWEAPGYHAGGHSGEDRGHGEPSYSSHASPPAGYGYSSNEVHGYGSHGGHGEQGNHGYKNDDLAYGHYSGENRGEYESEEKKKKKKKGGHGGLLLGAAGGLAVGALGGALIANALDDSSDEEKHHAPAPVYAAPAPVYSEPVYEPAYNADGEYVDASDRESVRSARENYEEALAKAQDSDASSSDFEELEEAREEYEEEYEEAYD